MKVFLYPILTSTFFRRTFLFPLALLLSLLSISLSTAAKTIVVGSGSGSVSVTSMSGINPGDVIAITPGTYAGGARFAGIHDVTIINNGGVVTFTATVDFGGNGPSMSNITWTGTGDPSNFYGFVFDGTGGYGPGPLGYPTGDGIRMTATTNSGIRINHTYFYNLNGVPGVNNAAIDLNVNTPIYNGSSSSFKLQNATISYCKFNQCNSAYLSGNYGLPASLNCLVDSLDFSYDSLIQCQSPGGYVYGNIFRFHAHHNWILYSGHNTRTGDEGVFNTGGNGIFDHNYMHGGRGYLSRLFGCSVTSYGVADSWAYDNIILATTTYAAFDWRSQSSPYYGGNSFLGHCNLHIVNNTVGNKSDDMGYIAPIVTVDNLNDGATIEVRNNLAFNLVQGGGSYIATDYSNNTWNTESADTSNNKYYSASAILNYLLDTVNCYLKPGSPLIDAGTAAGKISSIVTTDFSGIPRPQGSGFDIGAREYSSAISFVTANAGSNQTITLPTNSVSLSGSSSSVVNSTITSYAWSQQSGPSTATIQSNSAVNTMVSTLVAGTYIFSLKVVDANNDSSTASVTVVVNPANPPTVNAGPNQTITLPSNSLTLTGSASSSQSISSYQWTQVSGPNSASFGTPSALSTNISGLIAGIYVFQLKVVDVLNLSSSATVTVTVNAANQPPVANAGSNQTITLPTNTVSVNGSASKDPDGSIVSFNWSKTSGPSQGSITNASAISTTITNLVQGTYVFKLTVTDNNGATGTDSITITVNAATNQLPVANAGSSKTITLPVNSTSLDGTKSSDPDGTIASYNWAQVSGPSTATISNSSTATPTVSNLIAGKYVFSLQVTDNNGATATAQVSITVNSATNTNPVANAGANQTIILPVNTVTVDGSASIATGGASIISFSWTKISGPAATISNPNNISTTITGLVQGLYAFQLTVTDNNGNKGADTISVTVNAPINQPPVANAGPAKTITLPVSSVTLDGTLSTDPNGTIASYNWVQVSGPSTATISNGSTATATASGLVAGQYIFQLTVTDNNSASNSAQVKITVLPAANQPPVADAGSNQTITLPTSTVNLDASKSYDPDGTIVAYNWSKASGNGAVTISNPNTAKPTVSGLQAGSYVFKLTVADNDGATASAQVTITVNAAIIVPQPPVANAGRDTTIAIPANSATLNGTASSASSGNIISYNWTQKSGPSTSDISSPASAITNVNTLIAGVYVFELTVTDDHGGTASATVQVTVTDNTRLASGQSLLLYPNPTSNTLNLQITSDTVGDMKVIIYDMLGRVSMIKEYNKTSSYFSTPINVTSLFGGTYFLHTTINNKTVMAGKFIKQ